LRHLSSFPTRRSSDLFCYECLHVLVADSIVVCHHIIDGIVVHMIAQYLFGTDLVTVCHSHVVHLVAEADDEHILRISPCGSYAQDRKSTRLNSSNVSI